MTADRWAGIKNSLLLEYRCRAKRCLLLRVWQTPSGPEFFAPGHRLSDRYEFARYFEQIALDGSLGEGEGGALGGPLDERWWVGMWVPLTCDHVQVHTSMFAIREDLGDRPGRPRRILWPRDTPCHE